jgi:Zn finger protein HypA/HybF involved in hydrogenase expression
VRVYFESVQGVPAGTEETLNVNFAKEVRLMKCLTCKTEMECKDDVNDVSTRIDWVVCPKCGSTAEITYGNNGEYIEKVFWER